MSKEKMKPTPLPKNVLKLLKDVYEFITRSNKIDWYDEVTSRVYKTIKKYEHL